MRFFSPLLGKSQKIAQATYNMTLGGTPATIGGTPATRVGAFENMNNDIYGIGSGGIIDSWVGLGNVVSGMTVGFSNQRLFTGLGVNNYNARVDATQYDIGYLDDVASGDDWDVATGAGAELVTEGTEFNSGWGDFSGGTAVQSTDQAYEGTYSLKTTGSAAFAGMQSDVNIAVVAATKYKVSTRVYGDGVASIVFRVIDGGNLSDKYGPGGTNGIVYPAGWNYVAWEFTADDTENLRMQSYSRFAGAFTVYYDEISLTTGELAYTSTWYDQVGSNDAVQTTTTQQPLVTRDGVHVFDGSNDILKSPFQLTDGDNYTVLIVLTSTTTSTTKDILSITDIANTCIRINRQSAANLSFDNRVGGAASPWRWDASALWNGGRGLLAITFESGVGANCKFNNVALTPTRFGNSGTTDTNIGEIEIQGNGSTGNGEDAVEMVAIYDGTTLTDQNLTDIYNQWLINDPNTNLVTVGGQLIKDDGLYIIEI